VCPQSEDGIEPKYWLISGIWAFDYRTYKVLNEVGVINNWSLANLAGFGYVLHQEIISVLCNKIVGTIFEKLSCFMQNQVEKSE
jgi:hypothetical protein